MKSKREVIKEALRIQIETNGFIPDIFTSEDILTAVGISETNVEDLKEDFNSKIDEFLNSIGV